MTRNQRQETPEQVQGRVLHRLGTEGVEAAYEALLGVCRDPKAASQARATAANTLFKAAGLLEARDLAPKEPFEMTAAELAEAIRDLEALKARRAAARAAEEYDGGEAEGLFD